MTRVDARRLDLSSFVIVTSRETEGIQLRFMNSMNGTVVLETAALDQLIGGLGRARGQIAPPVREEYEVGQHRDVISDPRSALEVEALNGDVFLTIRDPRFGWLRFLFSKDEARQLGIQLQEAAEQAPPAQELRTSRKKSGR